MVISDGRLGVRYASFHEALTLMVMSDGRLNVRYASARKDSEDGGRRLD